MRMPVLEVHLLSDFNLSHNGVPVATLNSSRQQSLFAYLMLHSGAPQTRQSLSFLFWPDSSESQARTNLRKLLHDLQRSLPDADHFLEVDSQTLCWRSDAPFTLDVAEFENAVSRAESASELEEAVALYRGDLLPNCYDDWILPERERLHLLFVETLKRLIEMLESQREYSKAITQAQHLLQYDPLHEDAYRRLMRLYALSGDRAGVLRTYHACATVLQRELDVGPSPATRKVYEQLLNTDMPLSQLPPPVPSLVGRQREWAQLQAAWRMAVAGQPHWVILTGEEGIGKTRLAEEVLLWAARQGVTTSSTQCHVAENALAYAPVQALLRAHSLPSLDKIWLAEIARLLPELLINHRDLSTQGSSAEPWQRHRFFEALARAILGRQPHLVLIDDLQWCDGDTLEWLSYLLRFDPSARLLLVSTLRTQDLKADHPLHALMPALSHDGVMTEINLAPLSEAETALLAAKAAGKELDPAMVAWLYEQTGGRPFFILEMIQAGLPLDIHTLPGSKPQAMQATIAARLAKLSPVARALTALAATMGRAFIPRMLARADGTSEDDLVRGLDELWQQRIIREQAPDGYDFSHTQLSEVAYAGLSQERRQLLHRKMAEALEAAYETNVDMVSGEIATHFEQAGLPARAIPYYIRAGDAARALYANDAAINSYQRALSLLPDGKERIGLLVKLGDVWQLVGKSEEAEPLYQQAKQLAEKAGDS
jgi:DNA-binding SARP family transcriptional activator